MHHCLSLMDYLGFQQHSHGTVGVDWWTDLETLSWFFFGEMFQEKLQDTSFGFFDLKHDTNSIETDGLVTK